MSNPLPLTGVRVFELGSNLSGPYGTWILAALGADVIKVERPGTGDDARAWGPPFWREAATVFQVVNRDKSSITVDYKDPIALADLRRRITDEADVVLQNLRPGVADGLGLGATDMRALKPALIYCNLWAFGATGPLSERPGFDALMQAFGGIMAVTGEEGQAPVRAGISVVDMGTGEPPKRHGSGVRGIAPYQAYDCADGYLVVAVSNDRLFANLARELGHPEWLDDPRFTDNPARASNREDLNALLIPLFKEQPRAHWQERLDQAGVPNAPIQHAGEVITHPQTQALGMLQDTGAGISLTGLPLSFDGERPALRNIAPDLPEGNDD